MVLESKWLLRLRLPRCNLNNFLQLVLEGNRLLRLSFPKGNQERCG